MARSDLTNNIYKVTRLLQDMYIGCRHIIVVNSNDSEFDISLPNAGSPFVIAMELEMFFLFRTKSFEAHNQFYCR
jgi:hypothetical protein